MTCEHCVRAVTTEIGKIPGVSSVEVDLASGQVTIAAEPIPDYATVSAAVDAAGYEMAS